MTDAAFVLSDSPLDAAALAHDLANAGAGACITFEGWVRNQMPVGRFAASTTRPMAHSRVAKARRYSPRRVNGSLF